MTKEQLEDIEKFAEYRLRVGSADAAQILLVSKELRNAWAEIERLNNHLHPKPEHPMSAKKLYEVTVNYTYYAYAKDEHEACRYARDSMRDSFTDSDASPVEIKHCDVPIAVGWDEFCLVYHDGTEGDLTLDDILSKLPPGGTR